MTTTESNTENVQMPTEATAGTKETAGTEGTDNKVKRSVTPRDVSYELEIVDELPDASRTGGGSILEGQLAKVKAMVESGELEVGKYVKIGDYRVNSACTSASLALRQRHGKSPAVAGWSFASRKLESGRQGLYVSYNPAAIVEGAKEAHDAEERAKAEARKLRAEAKKNSNGTPKPGRPRKEG